MRKCTLCKIVKSESEFHKNVRSPSGLTPRCKLCRNKEAKRKSVKRLNHARDALSRTEKKCISCLLVKKLSDFPHNSEYIDGRLNKCIECRRLYKKSQYKAGGKERANAYYKNNNSKINESNKSRRNLAKLEYINLLGGSCAHCYVTPSNDLPVACFDFHHVGDTKDMDMSKMSKFRFPYNNQKAILELTKCIVLCANCHRKHHYLNGK